MIESGLLLFFLVPGLLACCAFYGTSHSGRSIAPEPPPGSSEIVTLVLLSSAVVHFTTATLTWLNHLVASHVGALLTLPAGLVDPYAAAFRAIRDQQADGHAIGGLIGIALLQGGIAYHLVRRHLRNLAGRDQLPAWIYG